MRPAALIPLSLFFAGLTLAQTPDGSLSGLVKADAATLDAHPTLAAWQRMHASEKRVEPSYEDPEYETQGLWCAGSRASIRLSNDILVNRLALFYVPGQIAALPTRGNPTLAERCELFSLWYSVDKPADPASFAGAVAKELAQTWGPAQEAPQFSPVRRGWGWGYWDPLLYWHQPSRRVVVAVDPKGRVLDGRSPPSPRALVIVRGANDPDGSLEHTLNFIPTTQPLLARTDEIGTLVAGMENPCSFEAHGPRCAAPNGLGTGFPAACRSQTCACFTEGKNDWREALIEFGEATLKQSENGKWTPFIHWILGRTYEARLQLTVPGAFIDVIAQKTTPPEPVRLRDAAVNHFRAFLAAGSTARPDNPDAAFARSEAWRLLAGLPPTPIHFGCSNE